MFLGALSEIYSLDGLNAFPRAVDSASICGKQCPRLMKAYKTQPDHKFGHIIQPGRSGYFKNCKYLRHSVRAPRSRGRYYSSIVKNNSTHIYILNSPCELTLIVICVFRRARIEKGKQAVKITPLLCHRFRSHEVLPWLIVIVYNLGDLWRRLPPPKRFESC